MSDFVFKNLSLKLLPEEGVARQADCKCCSFVVGCGNCTDVTCGPCTNTCTNCTNCTHGPTCGACTNSATHDPCGGCTCDQFTNPIITKPDANQMPIGDIRAELAAHKERLRQGLAQVEEQELELEARGKPRSLEEIDQLKSHLLEAIAELDEQRAQMESGKEPGPK